MRMIDAALERAENGAFHRRLAGPSLADIEAPAPPEYLPSQVLKCEKMPEIDLKNTRPRRILIGPFT
jgi:hypothetical protein